MRNSNHSRALATFFAVTCALAAGVFVAGCNSRKDNKEPDRKGDDGTIAKPEALPFHDDAMFSLLPKDIVALTSQDVAGVVSQKQFADQVPMISKSDSFRSTSKAGLSIHDISRLVSGRTERGDDVEVVLLKKDIDMTRLSEGGKPQSVSDKVYYRVEPDGIGLPTFVHAASKRLLVQSRHEGLLRQVLETTNGKSSLPRELAELLQHAPAAAHHVSATTKPFIVPALPNLPHTKLGQSISGSISSMRIDGDKIEQTEIKLFPSEDEAKRYSEAAEADAKTMDKDRAFYQSLKLSDEEIKAMEDSLRTRRFWCNGRAAFQSLRMNTNMVFRKSASIPEPPKPVPK